MEAVILKNGMVKFPLKKGMPVQRFDIDELELTINNVLFFLYVVVFFIGLVGNILVIIIITLVRQMQTMTNKLIINLAISDFLVIFMCIPSTALLVRYPGWMLGKYFCYMSTYTQSVSLSVSVMTLAVISTYRYCIIFRPTQVRTMFTTYNVKCMMGVIWILALLITFPLFMTQEYHEVNLTPLPNGMNVSFCVESWSNFEVKLAYNGALVLFMFVFPVCFMAYAYYFIVAKLIELTRNNEADIKLKRELRILATRRARFKELDGNDDNDEDDDDCAFKNAICLFKSKSNEQLKEKSARKGLSANRRRLSLPASMITFERKRAKNERLSKSMNEETGFNRYNELNIEKITDDGKGNNSDEMIDFETIRNQLTNPSSSVTQSIRFKRIQWNHKKDLINEFRKEPIRNELNVSVIPRVGSFVRNKSLHFTCLVRTVRP